MRALVQMLAARSGGLLNYSTLGNDLGLGASTAQRYVALLEEVFLVKRIPAWSRNISNRASRTAKLAFVDSGVAAHQVGADARNLLRPTGLFGPLLEGFVQTELARQLTWSEEEVELFHYRTETRSRWMPYWRIAEAKSSVSKSKRLRPFVPTTSEGYDTSRTSRRRCPSGYRAAYRAANSPFRPEDDRSPGERPVGNRESCAARLRPRGSGLSRAFVTDRGSGKCQVVNRAQGRGFAAPHAFANDLRQHLADPIPHLHASTDASDILNGLGEFAVGDEVVVMPAQRRPRRQRLRPAPVE